LRVGAYAARPMRLNALLLAAVMLVGCGSSTKDKKAEKTATATPPATVEATGCQKVKAPASKGDGDLKKPHALLDATKTYTAVVDTSCGSFEIRLDVKRAPKTAASFASLAKKKFFDNTTFHRIVPGFVIQGGDPLGDGTGGPGYTVVEAPPKSLGYTRGVVAMAKGPTEPYGASGSQFFVVTGEDAGLPAQYALLGKVTEGQDVVDTIGTTPSDPGTEAPLDPVLIKSITIKES
jgi:peptidyl-prolyl cis-trans isomerase B (cyclophilin B)